MTNINFLVFEALMTATSDPSTSGVTSDSNSSNNNEKGNLSQSQKPTISQTKSTPHVQNQFNFQTKYPTLQNFINKKKPQYGLGSGKSLMGW